MDTETSAHETIVPIKVSQAHDDAPPALAEPASGPAAEMSGALPAAESGPAAISTNVEASPANGTANSDPKIPLPSTAANTVDHPVKLAPEVIDQTESQDDKGAAEPEAEEAADQVAPGPNGTPAAKKGGNNGKRKSIGGVPEHKNKKLNKKKSMPKMTHLDAKPGDLYFARLKSYPPWPSIVCDEEMLPQTLLSTRPVTTMKKDGTYNEAYADGGKKVTERTFAVMFLFTNEFAWIPNTDLGPLNPEDCKDVSEKGKSKSLIAAYNVAAEGHELQYFKDMLMDHAKAIQEDEELRDAKLAEKAEKAAKAEKAKAEKTKPEKKKRKSEAKNEAEDVEMKDGDSDTAAKKSSKKRKKDAESDDEDTEKPVKTPKTTKLKLTTGKTPTTTEKKPKEKAAKPKSEKRKSKAAATSDEEMADAPVEEAEQPPMDPVEARKAREKEVLFLRHKLQKGFLSRDQAPQEEEMPQMSNFVKKLENYGDLEVSIIRNTKINKVLKALVKLNSIPKDEEFNFRKRSVELLAKWNKILGADSTEGETSGDKESKATPTTNGVHDEPSEEKKEELGTLADKPAQSESAKEESKDGTTQVDASITEPAKADSSSGVIEKAPESAQAAAEVNQVVKDAE